VQTKFCSARLEILALQLHAWPLWSQHPMSSTSTRMLRANQRCGTSHTTARVSGQCPTSC
jgi:hypothetical protein